MAVRTYGRGVPDDAGDDRQAGFHRADDTRGKARVPRTGAAGPEGADGADERLVEAVVGFRLEALRPYADIAFGNPFGTVVAVKGARRPGRGAGGASGLAGGFLDRADGIALEKALCALGYPPGCLFGIWLDGPQDPRAGSLRSLIELVDPKVLVALDARAGAALLAAYAHDEVCDVPLGRDGRPSPAKLICGRKAVLLDDFEGDLADDAAKRRAWSVLRELA